MNLLKKILIVACLISMNNFSFAMQNKQSNKLVKINKNDNCAFLKIPTEVLAEIFRFIYNRNDNEASETDSFNSLEDFINVASSCKQLYYGFIIKQGATPIKNGSGEISYLERNYYPVVFMMWPHIDSIKSVAKFMKTTKHNLCITATSLITKKQLANLIYANTDKIVGLSLIAFDFKTIFVDPMKKCFRKLVNLQNLRCDDCRNLKDSFFLNLINLKKLKCDRSDLTDKALKNLKNLEILYCSGCKKITDKGICLLDKLIKLDCSLCQGITDEGIYKSKKLEELDCSFCENITNKGISGLEILKKLICVACNGITDEGTGKLKNIKYIKFAVGVTSILDYGSKVDKTGVNSTIPSKKN